MLKDACVIGLIALIGSACSTSRSASVKAEVRSLTAEVRDSSRVEQVMVAVHDTIMETTTITVDRNETGDTVRVSTVTDRDRVRNHTGFKVHDSRVTVKRDTVYVERRDSVRVYGSGLMVQGSGVMVQGSSRASPFVRAVKWVVAVMVVICILGMMRRN